MIELTAEKALSRVEKKRKRVMKRNINRLQRKIHREIMFCIKESVKKNKTHAAMFIQTVSKKYIGLPSEKDVIKAECEKLKEMGYKIDFSTCSWDTRHDCISVDWSRED